MSVVLDEGEAGRDLTGALFDVPKMARDLTDAFCEGVGKLEEFCQLFLVYVGVATSDASDKAVFHLND
jgi:hypothetical protein